MSDWRCERRHSWIAYCTICGKDFAGEGENYAGWAGNEAAQEWLEKMARGHTKETGHTSIIIGYMME